MEAGTFGVPIDMASRNPVILDGIPSLVQLDSFDLNIQNQVMVGFPVLSTLNGEAMSDLNGELNMTNHYSLVHPTGFQKQYGDGTTPISSTSLATLLATRNNLPGNLNKLAISAPSMMPFDVSRNYVSNECSDASNSSFANSVNCGYDEALGSMNSEWGFNKFSNNPPELDEKTQASTRVQSFLSMGNLDTNGWISSNCANLSSAFTKELSLSLATSQPSVIGGQNTPDRCSEMSCSAVTNNCLDETRFVRKQQTSCNSKELSLCVGSCPPAEFSQIISGSGYLPIIQEVLAQIASYSFENLDHMSYSSGGIGARENGKERRMLLMGCDEYPDSSSRFEVQIDPAMQRWAIEAKKTQLLALLQVVDDRYNQCLDEIHTIISAFHAVTELNPQIHVQFALHTISFYYKNLRERISNQILAMGAYINNGCTREEERFFENSFLTNQWALQHQKRKEQLWRPQRGLPERSVSVLRAWMFQNFLHPYPKDSDKHLLAVKSGLTRSQVSNWFINARVRLWKPMIEEMYSDMNRRKAHQNQEGTNNNYSSQMSINMQRFNTR